MKVPAGMTPTGVQGRVPMPQNRSLLRRIMVILIIKIKVILKRR